MLYHLFQYLESFDFPGAGVFQYITFRSACAIILSLIIATVVGKRVIRMLQRQQIGEEIRDLGLQGQMEKKGTPTMGGIIILLAILIPVLLFARLDNVYIQLMIISTIWLGLIGFADDYIKVFRKHKEGLKGRFKVIGQVGLGLIVGLTLYMNDEVVIRERAAVSEIGVVTSTVDEGFSAEGTQQVRTKDIFCGKICRRAGVAVVCFGYYFYHYSCVEWGESDRWSGWSGYRNVGDYRSDAGNPGLCVGEYGLCRLSEYHVHSAFRRIGGIRFCLYRSDDRVFVV